MPQARHAHPPDRHGARELCDPCQDELMGMTAGTIAGGGEVGPAIATAGFFKRLRERGRR